MVSKGRSASFSDSRASFTVPDPREFSGGEDRTTVGQWLERIGDPFSPEDSRLAARLVTWCVEGVHKFVQRSSWSRSPLPEVDLSRPFILKRGQSGQLDAEYQDKSGRIYIIKRVERLQKEISLRGVTGLDLDFLSGNLFRNSNGYFIVSVDTEEIASTQVDPMSIGLVERSLTDDSTEDAKEDPNDQRELTRKFLLSALESMSESQLRSIEEAARNILLAEEKVLVPLPQLEEGERLRAPRALWKERRNYPELAKLSVPDFIVAVYGEGGDGRIGKGFTQADLKKIDPSLYNALQKLPAGSWPKHVDLPTLEEWNQRQLDALGLTQLIERPELRKWLAVASGRAQRLGL